MSRPPPGPGKRRRGAPGSAAWPRGYGGAGPAASRRFPQGFHAMDRHLELLAERLRWQAWYTVGDSVLGGAYIPVHEALARLAREHGLEAETKPLGERFRPGRRLYLLVLRARG